MYIFPYLCIQTYFWWWRLPEDKKKYEMCNNFTVIVNIHNIYVNIFSITQGKWQQSFKKKEKKKPLVIWMCFAAAPVCSRFYLQTSDLNGLKRRNELEMISTSKAELQKKPTNITMDQWMFVGVKPFFSFGKIFLFCFTYSLAYSVQVFSSRRLFVREVTLRLKTLHHCRKSITFLIIRN